MPRPAGSSIAPIFLRIALGLTFVWAGLGKLEGEMRISGEPAAILANMGLHEVRKLAQPPVPAGPVVPVVTPPVSVPAPASTPSPAPDSVAPPSPQPTEQGAPPLSGGGPVAGAPATSAIPSESQPASTPVTATPPVLDAPPDSAPQPVLPSDITPQPADTQPTPLGTPSTVASPSPAKAPHIYTAAEFPKEVELKRVYGLSLILHRAANPSPRADSTLPARLWPQRFARGTWPLFFAWSVAIAEVAGGFFVLAGLLTRASALCLAAVMLGAMWLTELGPATQNNTTVLGFIPDRDWLQVDQWKTLFWQFSLMMSAMALAFLGSGALGFDRKLFPPAPPPPSHVKPLI